MRNTFFFFIILALSLGACNQEVKEENQKLKEENEALKEEKLNQDSTINDFANTFERIQTNLDSIRYREEAIREARANNIESAPSTREQILTDIKAINALLEDNQARIEDLQAKLGRQDRKMSGLNRIIDNLKSQLREKDEQITLLKQDLAAANFKMEQLNQKVGNLTEANIAQQEKIENQNAEINKVYFAIGTAKELEKNKVIDKEGGFIGLGKTKTLADDLDKDYFTEMNKSITKEIPLEIGKDEPELITSHPTDAYQWVEEDGKYTALKILDEEEFWQNSRYLVILID